MPRLLVDGVVAAELEAAEAAPEVGEGLALVGLRLVIVWVVNNTRGSVLMAILTHASWNTFYSAALIGLFPVRSVLGSYLNLTIAACALVLIAVLAAAFAPLGAALAHRLDQKTLKYVFAAFLVAVGLNMLWKVLAG